MNLTGKTSVVGLFGDPVNHSLSPQMQNAAISQLGLNAVYVPFHVTSARLSDAIQGIRAMGLSGVNLTIPHKESALLMVDEVDDSAKKIGAVNTIVNREGILCGYNTDGIGLIKALKQDLGLSLKGNRVLVIGAGGACRAALCALAEAGAAWIGVANRTRQRAAQLAEMMAENFSGTTFAHYLYGTALSGDMPHPIDLLINTTPIGLNDQSFDLDLKAIMESKGAVYDMVYGPRPTPLVCLAHQHNLAAADGLGMLIGQGEAAFKLWFGIDPPQGIMRRALVEAMKSLP
ncbi:MAG: shikimate dehydrogenase [Deltaproteobacteria bacterium]|jgi:shikimate dehydrogenase|nr:shikimate dehydrogenase [Deltaproteobacteria bacterium]MBW2504931.1 shikimate dehydrogenase [Deltaproteobacteria bacterium]